MESYTVDQSLFFQYLSPLEGRRVFDDNSSELF